MYQTYFGHDSGRLETYAMLYALANTTTRTTMFEPIELGYYSYSSLCIHNIFGVQESFFWYRVAYIMSISGFLLMVGYTLFI